MTTNAPSRSVVLASAVALSLASGAGCSKRKQPKPLESRPAAEPATPGPTAKTSPVTPVPTTAPATRPAETQPAQTQPVSTYDSRPPYPVRLYVRRPEQEQPGWLRIMELADDGQLATAAGKFPEKNHIYVDTQNVRRIRIHIGHLPLAGRKRIALHIDEQGIEIARKRREFITLERTPAGAWKVVKPKKQRR